MIRWSKIQVTPPDHFFCCFFVNTKKTLRLIVVRLAYVVFTLARVTTFYRENYRCTTAAVALLNSRGGSVRVN